ncbi:hypothetical protein NPS01_28330 [Nocardioides psychrotolerans]|nr:hypothetical protein NPS01_28330 [Nocardioides psychrotolerans]
MTIQARSVLARCSSVPMVGRAVLTTEMSRTTRTWAARAMARTDQERRGVSVACSWVAVRCGGCDMGTPRVGSEMVVRAGRRGSTTWVWRGVGQELKGAKRIAAVKAP